MTTIDLCLPMVISRPLNMRSTIRGVHLYHCQSAKTRPSVNPQTILDHKTVLIFNSISKLVGRKK